MACQDPAKHPSNSKENSAPPPQQHIPTLVQAREWYRYYPTLEDFDEVDRYHVERADIDIQDYQNFPAQTKTPTVSPYELGVEKKKVTVVVPPGLGFDSIAADSYSTPQRNIPFCFTQRFVNADLDAKNYLKRELQQQEVETQKQRVKILQQQIKLVEMQTKLEKQQRKVWETRNMVKEAISASVQSSPAGSGSSYATAKNEQVALTTAAENNVFETLSTGYESSCCTFCTCKEPDDPESSDTVAKSPESITNPAVKVADNISETSPPHFKVSYCSKANCYTRCSCHFTNSSDSESSCTGFSTDLLDRGNIPPAEPLSKSLLQSVEYGEFRENDRTEREWYERMRGKVRMWLIHLPNDPGEFEMAL